MRTIVEGSASVRRRDFLKMSGLGLSLAGAGLAFGAEPEGGRAVILLMLVGGPSQIETFDPKPKAPSEIRGPFRAIETRVPGVRIGEHLPRLARRMDRVTILRSLNHDAAPIHETGHQLLQAGRLSRPGDEPPHFGAVAASLPGGRDDMPAFVVLPRPIGNTGVGISHGQGGGILGSGFDPMHSDSDGEGPAGRSFRSALDLSAEPESTLNAYGRDPFGRNCLAARRLVEAGSRVVVVNMYETVFHQVSWDCHGFGPFSTLADYAEQVLPCFDRAYCALLDDLDRLGRLDSTLVVATGEFGRSPRINAQGGRDHWPGVWSALVAGGGTRGGQVIGASDANGSEPADRPIAPAELVATMYQGLGLDPTARFDAPGGESIALVDQARPIAELFS